MQQIQTILIELAAFASLGDTSSMRRIVLSKRFSSTPTRKIIETCLELHLFAGFPATIEALIVISPYLRRSKRIPRKVASSSELRSTGLSLLRKVYDRNFEKLLQNMESLDPDLADWIITYGYGQVLSRRGLSLQEREMIAVASLAALGWTRQLRSHVIGALNSGVLPFEIRRIWKILMKTLPIHTLSTSESAVFSALAMYKSGKNT